MTALDRVRSRAAELMGAHLADRSWAFAFDNAKTRAGQCDFARRRITVSRHLAVRFTPEDVEQVLLHEIAHALSGPRAGHGPTWRRTAAALGYTGSRLHDGPIASEARPVGGPLPRRTRALPVPDPHAPARLCPVFAPVRRAERHRMGAPSAL